MDVVQAEQEHGAFYAPAFQVKVAGRDVVREHFLTVTSVDVNLTLNRAARFSMTVANAFDLGVREFVAGSDGQRVDLLELFGFGRSVEIAMGYGEPRKLTKLMDGLVTEISTSFASNNAPELTISGYDHAFRMMNNENTRNWENATDSDAVQDIARRNNLSANVTATEEVHSRIEQNQETDLTFVIKLAERNGFEFRVDGNTLTFAPPRNDESEVIALEWGKGLLSFSPRANLARQVSRVEIYGWDSQNKRQIVGRARRGDEPGRDRNRRSAGDYVSTVLSEQPVLRRRQPVYTQQEANRRARAALQDRSEDFLRGDAEALGLAALRPDENVALKGVGQLFSKTYYIEQATHRVDQSGYRTRLSLKETTL